MSATDPKPITALTEEEKEAVLRALGFYQVHLFDELKSKPQSASLTKIESEKVTSAIKKIHKSIEPGKK
ncbi:MAG: hypothetical protein OK457_04850 [Thaumarchaeota archaeon]|nr:hypothetical protein [Nitrososphaerota archaeon]